MGDIPAHDPEMLSPEAVQQLLHQLRVYQIELEMQNDELRQTQMSLEASQVRYFDLYDLAPVGYFTVNEKGLILETNLTGAGLLGLTKHVLLKQLLSRFILHEDQNIYYHHCLKLFETGDPQVCELRMVRRDGTQFWARLESTVTQDVETNAPVSRIIVSNITERKQHENDILEREQRLRILTETIEEVFWMADVEVGKMLYISPGYERIWGLPRESLYDARKSLIEAIHPEDRGRVVTSLEVQKTGQPFEHEYRIVRPNGSIRWIWDRGFPIPSETGKVTRYAGVASDITERKQAEEARQATIELLQICNQSISLRDLVQNLNFYFQKLTQCEAIGVRLRQGDDFPYYEAIGFTDKFVLAENSICTCDQNGEIIRDNTGHPVLECMCGNIICGRFDPSKPYFTGHGSFWSSNTTQLLAGAIEADRHVGSLNRCNAEGYESVALVPLRLHGETFGLFQFNDKRRERFTLEKVALLEDLVGYVAIAVAKLKTDEALRESEEKFAKTFKYAPLLMTISNIQDGRYIEVNEKFLEVTGFTRDEAVGKTSVELGWISKEDRTKLVEVLNTFGRVKEMELSLTTKDKKSIACLYASEIVSINGIKRLLSIGQDITRRNHIEAQLRQVHKMEAIGTLAGGIAHDFNNILGSIIGYTELALLEAPREGELRYELDQIYKGGKRATDLVQQILTFSRQGEQLKKPLRISPVIKESLKLLRASLPSTIEIVQDISSADGTILAEPTQIHQIIMNLGINAMHAMQDKGGCLTVKLKQTEMTSKDSVKHLGLKTGPYLKLTVSDTGKGMDHRIIDNIFNPFFTTKAPDEGTGLGLSVVHGIVKSYKGAITVHSEPGEGTEFNLYLPQTFENMIVKEKFEEALVRGKGNILLVDDEEDLVNAEKLILEYLGYQVSSFTSSLASLETFRLQPDGFDLVISDQTMPDMTGLQLATELLNIRPHLPIIICTGYSANLTSEVAALHGIKAVVMKPLLAGNISKIIKELLEDKGNTDG
ncbi:MAG: PAS domain S-box protein [Deltaproteobacteria bacterium]|nr:PAS domain S-box protein [Deltaproteobacteria bacterium]